ADAADEPDEPGGVAELGGEHRPDQRPGAGDGREVVAEEHPPAGRKEVRAVALAVRRRHAGIVEHPQLRGNECAVVPVRNRQNPEDWDDEVKSTHKETIKYI